MSKTIHVIVAVVIASLAFGVGQVAPGYGAPFVVFTASLWIAYSVWRGRRDAKARQGAWRNLAPTTVRQMTSKQRFAGVAHDIAHHAQSGLSYLNPHVGEACRKYGLGQIDLDLLAEPRLPTAVARERSLRLAAGAVSRKFAEMVTNQGLDVSDLAFARLTLRPLSLDGSSTAVRSYLRLIDGRTFEREVR